MHKVIFTAPILNANALPTIRAVVSVPDTSVSLISQDRENLLPDDLRNTLAGFYYVENALSEDQLYEAAIRIQNHTGKTDRMFASNEQVQVPVAIVRERLGIKGMSADTMRNFRDKTRMKSVLAENTIACAKFMQVITPGEASDFISKIGYPVIIKPPEGAGAEFTYKVDDANTLRNVLEHHPPSQKNPLLVEEFITGDEFSFDSFSVKGKPVWHSLTRYLPSCLEVKRNPWMQWRVVLPREVDDPQYDDIREEAFKTLKVLGANTGISHMEWFRRPDGSVAISEVGMRPPGAQFTTIMSRAHAFDCMGSWAKLMITGKFTPPKRKFAAGCAYLRGQGSGLVRHIEGFDQVQQTLKGLITDFRLPALGQKPTGSYEGEGFVIVRHPETQVVEDALLQIVSTVRVWLGP